MTTATFFTVLVNDEDRQPVARCSPTGWRVVHGEASRAACLDYVEKNWTDLRRGLRDIGIAHSYDTDARRVHR